MNNPVISPPVAMTFESIEPFQVRNCRRGICPHCVTQTLREKHTSEGISFMQCSNCTVVVALEKGT